MTHTMARPLIQLLIPGVAALLAACGGAAPASAPASPSVASTAPKPASASAAASEAAKPGAPASAALSDPAAVALRYFDLANRGDKSGVAALFTDDAVFIGGAPCGVTTFCKGLAAIANGVESGAASHTKLTLSGAPLVAGNLVFMRWEARGDTEQSAGAERQIIVGNVIVVRDKIGGFAGLPDLSDAQTVKTVLYLQQQAQPSSSPAGSPPPKTSDPSAVVQHYTDIVNSGSAAVEATFAANAVNITPSPACSLRTPCTTAADIAKAEQPATSTHQNITRVGDWRVAGNVVQSVNDVRNDTLAAAGVERVRSIVTWQVAGDKILSRINLQDLSDPQTVKRQLYQQAQASASAGAKPAASAAASAKPAG